jgi:hypothetical protein
MSEPDVQEPQSYEEPPRLALPPPSYARNYAAPQPAGIVDAALLWIERHPLPAAGAIFLALTALHLLVLNLTGLASGIFIGDEFIFAAASTPIEIILLAFVAYNIVLPTLFAQACIKAFDELHPAFALDDRQFGQLRATLVDPFVITRIGAGFLWAFLLTPVFGSLLRSTIQADGTTGALLAIWMYVRIALTFGLLGASIGYVVLLHHRFRAATGTYLKVDLFDTAALKPVATYARNVALYLIVLLALAGPAIAQPEAMVASAAILAAGILLTVIAVAGAMWGARRATRAAKRVAFTELDAYARELWRRAYVNNRITEAVAIPALGAMLTVRNQIERLPDWPGGWGVFARLATLAIIPIVSWFGGQLVAQFMTTLPR